MQNALYKMMIANLQAYLRDSGNPREKAFDAFMVSEVLSVALAKDPTKIIMDLAAERKETLGEE